MVKFIDSHSHIYLSQFSEDVEECIDRAIKSGVTKIVLPNIDSESIPLLDALIEKYPQVCYGLMGLHPTYVKDNYKEELDSVIKALDAGKYVGVGEIGIDLYWDKTHVLQQIEVFIEQVKYSINNKMPFIIHARESFSEIFDTLNKIGASEYSGIFHAFTGNLDQAHKATEMGLLLGIGGIVTFKNAGLAEVVEQVDLNHLVLETDSPYLAPTPHRGKRNESSYITIIAKKIAEIKGVSIEEVARVTTQNAEKLFGI